MKKEDKEKIYNNIFKALFIVFIVSFLTLYISNSTGYFEYYHRQKIILTDEKIKQFEEDIKNGVNLDLESYLESTKQNYNNKASKFGLFISNKIGKYAKSIIEKTFEILNDIFKE